MKARIPYGREERKCWLELAFDASEYQIRDQRLRALLGSKDIDALLVWEDAGRAANVQYLTGFDMHWGTAAVLVQQSHPPVLITNAIAHGEPMHSNFQTIWTDDVRVAFGGKEPGVLDHLVRLFAERSLGTARVAIVGFERLPYGVARAILERWPQLKIVSADPLMSELRRIKSPAELEIIRRVAVITSKGMDAALDAATVGSSEADIAAAAHWGCVAAGAERMSFGCYAAAGQRGGLKNVFGRTDKKVASGELVVIDLGCTYRGYQSDISRNRVTDPSPAIVDILETCLAAQNQALANIRPGVTTTSVVSAMNQEVARRGFGAWDWSLCHGFGLELVEDPNFFDPENPQVLEAGMCFYVEPIMADLSFGCACIEDMVLVTEQGCEILSTSERMKW
jgi:Xaa-Pro aminopeptidase/Xaa-Pro dipeptidase